MAAPTDLPILPFPSQQDWEDWLRRNADQSAGVWIQFAKKASGIPTATYDEALEVALRFGWIDGQRRSLDERFFLQRFTPRRPRSPWSKRNVGFAEKLIEAGRMEPRGMLEVEAAKTDGRWDAPYDGPKDAAPHPDFMAALRKNKKAKAFFATISKRNQFAIYYRVQTAKRPETRAKRIDEFVAMLAEGRKVYP
jgi:uncharacterized protein YdeI (YjbR/CyaY-like superfamily)